MLDLQIPSAMPRSAPLGIWNSSLFLALPRIPHILLAFPSAGGL
jgi:hypothetical protein